MADIIRKDSLFKMFKENIFNIVFKNEIFTYSKIPSNKFEKKIPLDDLDKNNEELALIALENIILEKKDFYLLSNEYLVKKQGINLKGFKEFIINNCKGYYYKKAIVLLFFRFFFLIAGLCILYSLNHPEYICVDKPIDNNVKRFWIYKNEKYKVIEVKINYKEWFLRMVSTLIDIIFMICELIVLINLEKINGNVYLVISAQILKYFIDILVIVLVSTKEICEQSKNEKNIFYKKKNVLFLDLNIILIKYFLFKCFLFIKINNNGNGGLGPSSIS